MAFVNQHFSNTTGRYEHFLSSAGLQCGFLKLTCDIIKGLDTKPRKQEAREDKSDEVN